VIGHLAGQDGAVLLQGIVTVVQQEKCREAVK